LISSRLRRFRSGTSWFSVIETVHQKSRMTTRCGWYDAYGLGWNLDLLLRLWIKTRARFSLVFYELSEAG
jgi:hypothetical protein